MLGFKGLVLMYWSMGVLLVGMNGGLELIGGLRGLWGDLMGG